MKLQWIRTVTTKPGFYLWRNIMHEEPEVIQIWGLRRGQRRLGSPPSYNWTLPRLGDVMLLGKRMHDPEGVEHDELSGFFLVRAGDATKSPVSVDELLDMAEQPVEEGIELLRKRAVDAEASCESLRDRVAELELGIPPAAGEEKLAKKAKAKKAK